jgi:hypothetical protein
MSPTQKAIAINYSCSPRATRSKRAQITYLRWQDFVIRCIQHFIENVENGRNIVFETVLQFIAGGIRELRSRRDYELEKEF